MDALLQSVKFDEQFEYEIQKGKQLYVAGVKKVRLNPDAKLSGRLYLDELFMKTEKRTTFLLGRPLFPSEDYDPTYLHKTEKRKNIFSIKPIIIERTLDQFVENIRLGLIKRYRSTMNSEDIHYFFDRIHEHYDIL